MKPKFARRTLDSIANQTIPPALWVIVDDGSHDETPQILEEYAKKFPYIRIIRRADRGDRKLGGGVIEAFDEGYKTINPIDFDYVCKLDLDLDIPSVYFEELMKRMEANPRIGTCSGKPYMDLNGKLVSEKCGDENSVGMIKFYRTDLLQADRRVRAGADVGWHRLPPLPHARMDRGQLGRSGDSLHTPATDGDEPQELVDGPGAARVRPILHGDRSGLHAGQLRLPNVSSPRSARLAGDDVGLSSQCDPP